MCYVNTSRSMSQLQKDLEESHVSVDKLTFIDNVTKKTNKKVGNCLYIGAKRDFASLSLAINFTLDSGSFGCFLFDSISSLHTYGGAEVLTRFLHDLFLSVKKSNSFVVFTINSGEDTLMQDVGMFADYIVELT